MDVEERWTPRLHLRRLTRADMPVMVSIRADPRTNAIGPVGHLRLPTAPGPSRSSCTDGTSTGLVTGLSSRAEPSSASREYGRRCSAIARAGTSTTGSRPRSGGRRRRGSRQGGGASGGRPKPFLASGRSHSSDEPSGCAGSGEGRTDPATRSRCGRLHNLRAPLVVALGHPPARTCSGGVLFAELVE